MKKFLLLTSAAILALATAGAPGLAFAALGMLWLGRNRQGRFMPRQASP